MQTYHYLYETTKNGFLKICLLSLLLTIFLANRTAMHAYTAAQRSELQPTDSFARADFVPLAHIDRANETGYSANNLKGTEYRRWRLK